LPNIALGIQDIFAKLTPPDGAPPITSMKDHLTAKTPALLSKVRLLKNNIFFELTGLEASEDHYQMLRSSLEEALKEAKAENDARPVMNPGNIMSDIEGLGSNDI